MADTSQVIPVDPAILAQYTQLLKQLQSFGLPTQDLAHMATYQAKAEPIQRQMMNLAAPAFQNLPPAPDGYEYQLDPYKGGIVLNKKGSLFGSILKVLAPAAAALIPGLGPIAAGAIGAGGSALGGAISGDPFNLLKTVIAGAVPAVSQGFGLPNQIFGGGGSAAAAPSAASGAAGGGGGLGTLASTPITYGGGMGAAGASLPLATAAGGGSFLPAALPAGASALGAGGAAGAGAMAAGGGGGGFGSVGKFLSGPGGAIVGGVAKGAADMLNSSANRNAEQARTAAGLGLQYQKYMDTAGLRDRLIYNLTQRMGLQPKTFAPTDIFNQTQGSAAAGVSPEDYGKSIAGYTPGAGGVNTALAKWAIGRLGYGG